MSRRCRLSDIAPAELRYTFGAIFAFGKRYVPSGRDADFVRGGYIISHSPQGESIVTKRSGVISRGTQHIRDNIYAKSAVKRFATTDEVAEAVRFCINNGFVNGSVIEVSGGYSFK